MTETRAAIDKLKAALTNSNETNSDSFTKNEVELRLQTTYTSQKECNTIKFSIR
jgi:hypothetical protein